MPPDTRAGSRATRDRSPPGRYDHPVRTTARAGREAEISVLNVVTNDDSRFFKQQVAALEARGVRQHTVSIREERTDGQGSVTAGRVGRYLGLVPEVIAESCGDYDLVHANYGLTAPAALAQPSLPVVVSLWGTDLMGRFGYVSSACARFADAVVVMTPEMASMLPVDAHVIPHGVDTERFTPAPKADAREELGWDRYGRYVLFPYPPDRDVKDYPRAERVVEGASERLGVDVDLRPVVGVPHEEMSTYYNAADLLLLTSRREGSPNAVKEALACDTPVVATDVGDVRTRLAGVDNAHVCRSDDDLIAGVTSVLSGDGRVDGREAIRDCSVASMAEQLHGVYRSVLDDR